MYQRIVTLAFLFGRFLISPSSAQEADFSKNRFYIGGSLFHPETKTVQKKDGYHVSGRSVLLGYERCFNSKWSMAIHGYLKRVSGSIDAKPGEHTSYSETLSSVQIIGRFNWHSGSIDPFQYRLYTGASLGVKNVVTKILEQQGGGSEMIDFGLAGQLDIVAGEISWKWLGLWAELGYGTQGPLKAGISFNF